MTIHPDAQRGFERDPDAYERGRPDYPEAAIEWLIARLDLRPGRTVVDVGAGTGKLTRRLLPSGAALVAVEPVEPMRELIARFAPGARALEGTAEAIPLDDACADAIVVGQAFHWFDGPAALEEFHRVLHARGRLALVWNRRDMDQPLQQAIDEIIEPLRGTTPSHRSGNWKRAFEGNSSFTAVGERTVQFEQRVGETEFVDRIGSISFIASLEGPQRQEVLARVRRLAQEHCSEPLAYVSELFVFERG